MNSVQYKNYLCHHGIKGMHWGERNGPPYPLGSGDHSAEERRYMSGGNSTSAGGSKKEGKKTNQNGKSKKGDSSNSSFDYEKAIKIGAAVAATGLVAYGAYKLHSKISSGALDGIAGAAIGKDKRTWSIIGPDADGDYSPLNELPMIADKASVGTEKDFMKMNPGVIKMPLSGPVEVIKGEGTNCAVCTTVYDLRQRGIDVQAKAVPAPGLQLKRIEDFWQGNRTFDDTGDVIMNEIGPYQHRPIYPTIFDSQKFIEENKIKAQPFAEKLARDAVTDYPEGARGNIVVRWCTGGGHSMAWEIKDGAFHVRDAQIHDYDVDLPKLFKNVKLDTVQMMRTDDLEPDMVFLRQRLRTTSNAEHMLKHSPEAVINLGMKSVEGQLAIYGGTAAYVTHRSKSNTEKIKTYKKAHPNTKMTDAQILQSVNKKKK